MHTHTMPHPLPPHTDVNVHRHTLMLMCTLYRHTLMCTVRVVREACDTGDTFSGTSASIIDTSALFKGVPPRAVAFAREQGDMFLLTA